MLSNFASMVERSMGECTHVGEIVGDIDQGKRGTEKGQEAGIGIGVH